VIDPTIIRAESLTEAQIAAARDLLALVNAQDGLDLKLAIPAPVVTFPWYFLVYRNGQLVGFVGTEGSFYREACGMVHPDARREGLGHALLGDVVDLCRKQEARQLLVICEDASTGGRALMASWGTQRQFTEWHMELADLSERPARGLPVVVLPATMPDLRAIASIQSAAFGNASADDAQSAIIQDFNTPESCYYVGWRAETPVGALKVFFTDGRALIYGFAVSPDHQNQGVGRQILTAVIRELRAQGWQRIGLEVDATNDRAIALYRSLGFTIRTVYGYYDVRL
jgi:ribosomal protein S18 acetylase RimI-like enzyme